VESLRGKLTRKKEYDNQNLPRKVDELQDEIPSAIYLSILPETFM